MIDIVKKIYIKPGDYCVIQDLLDVVEDNTEIYCSEGVYKIDRPLDIGDLAKRNIKIIGATLEGCGDFRYEGK